MHANAVLRHQEGDTRACHVFNDRTVLRHVTWVVADVSSDVERRIRGVADAAVTGGEERANREPGVDHRLPKELGDVEGVVSDPRARDIDGVGVKICLDHFGNRAGLQRGHDGVEFLCGGRRGCVLKTAERTLVLARGWRAAVEACRDDRDAAARRRARRR